MDGLARERYEIITTPASLVRRVFGPIAVLFTNVVTMGGGPANPGGRTFVVRDKQSGDVLFERRETFADDQTGLGEAIQRDLDTLTADAFEAEWVDQAS